MVFGDAMLSTTLSPAIGWCLGKQWDEQRRSRYTESTCWRATDQPEVLDSHFSWGHGWYGSVDQWYQYQTTKLFYIEPCLKAPGWRHSLRFPRNMEKNRHHQNLVIFCNEKNLTFDVFKWSHFSVQEVYHLVCIHSDDSESLHLDGHWHPGASS